ncbi:MAG: hypothetical protein ACK5U8_26990 [Deltaproteobacteria bacterium]
MNENQWMKAVVTSVALLSAGCGGRETMDADAAVVRGDAATLDARTSPEDAGMMEGADAFSATDAFLATERDAALGPTDAAPSAPDAVLVPADESAWAVVSTVAGSGTRGTADGPAASATFSDPTGLAFEADGALLVLDRGRGRVRRVSTTGSVSTVALTGTLRGPYALAIASDGSWLVSDSDDSCIKRVVAGVVSTYAGLCGRSGTVDGDSATARFDRPRQIALDATGTLWVVDGNNHTLRRVAPDGSVTTHAGVATVPGFADAARPGSFYYPWGLALAADGVLVAGQDSCVRRVTDTRVDRLAGSCGNFGNTGFVDGAGSTARFDWIKGLTVAPWATLYAADSGNDAIRAVEADGTTRTIAGSTAGWADGPLASALFRGPNGLVDGPDGALYVADTDNQRIRRIGPR